MQLTGMPANGQTQRGNMIDTWKEYLCWKAWRYSLDQELIAFMLNDWRNV